MRLKKRRPIRRHVGSAKVTDKGKRLSEQSGCMGGTSPELDIQLLMFGSETQQHKDDETLRLTLKMLKVKPLIKKELL